jgi:hypothetical protein
MVKFTRASGSQQVVHGVSESSSAWSRTHQQFAETIHETDCLRCVCTEVKDHKQTHASTTNACKSWISRKNATTSNKTPSACNTMQAQERGLIQLGGRLGLQLRFERIHFDVHAQIVNHSPAAIPHATVNLTKRALRLY